jgi:hypothetical protein
MFLLKSNRNRIVFCYQIECFCSNRIESYLNRIKWLFQFSIRFASIRSWRKRGQEKRQIATGKIKNLQNRILKGNLRCLCLYSGQFFWKLTIFLMANFLSWMSMQFNIESNRFLNRIDIESISNRIKRFPQLLDQLKIESKPIRFDSPASSHHGFCNFWFFPSNFLPLTYKTQIHSWRKLNYQV